MTEHDGTLHVLCFSNDGPDTGPHPITQEELRAAFNSSYGWNVAAIEPDRIQTRFHDNGAPGLARDNQMDFRLRDWSAQVRPGGPLSRAYFGENSLHQHGVGNILGMVRLALARSLRRACSAFAHHDRGEQ